MTRVNKKHYCKFTFYEPFPCGECDDNICAMKKIYNDRCRELDEWIKPFIEKLNEVLKEQKK